MIGDPNEDLAKRRFLTLSLLRLFGAGMAMAGALIVAGKIELDVIAGYVLLAAGLGDLLIVPPLLARSWKSPPQ